MAFDLSEYEPVASRLDKWLKAHPEGRVITELVHYLADVAVFRAELWLNGEMIATGWAEEIRGAGYVNATSHVENAETSAIGRALSNAGMAGSDFTKRPSREEMSKVQRTQQAQAQTAPTDGTVRVKGAQHGPLPEWLVKAATEEHIYEVYDNRDKVGDTKRPWFKATMVDKAFWPPRGNTALPIVPITPDDVEDPF